MIVSVNHILGEASLVTLLVRLSDYERSYNSHREKRGEKPLRAFNRKMLSTKIFSITNMITCFDPAKSYFSPQKFFKVNNELYITSDLNTS